MRNKSISEAQHGFTLIELMITVGLVAILATIATGSYRNYVRRANRAEGTAALMTIQVAEEKYYLQNGTYTASLTAVPPAGLGMSATTLPNGNYTLNVGPGGSGAIANSYLATATATGSQTDDSDCPVLTVNDQGIKSPSATTSPCWH